MHRIRFALIALVFGCTGGDTIAPGQPAHPLDSITINAPLIMIVGESIRLETTIRDVAQNFVTNRDVDWASSDASVAIVDAAGVVKAVGIGSVTISAKSGAVAAEAIIAVESATGRGCAPDTSVECLAYRLLRVNEQALPVHSPWGIGDWDYDADAGTWELTSATLTLFADGVYTYATTHQAFSGQTLDEVARGRFVRTSASLQFSGNDRETFSATISGNSLIVRYDNATTFTFER